ncbi:WD repeat-containing protein 73 [Tachyglossus aculeatus]|uniref:WD repeat-containing protein 73 n=1 Tax=Tachyglossus aculeatus TaxID=9261 RepID=UPI0018F62FA5|nr:WD repeat-containing protein 73 [Tachyglossus aculeatus]
MQAPPPETSPAPNKRTPGEGAERRLRCAAAGAMEMEEEAAAEDWLVESLRLYKDLHAFELQGPTRVIEWTGDKSVCVAGCEHQEKNEILQLLLPPKLCAQEKQSLCPDRDFRVERGGFSGRPVYNLKRVPDTRLLVTSGPPGDALHVWEMAEDSDIIRAVGAIGTGAGAEGPWPRIAATVGRPPGVVHGARLGDVRITEVESRAVVFRAGLSGDDEVSSLQVLDADTFLLCCASGKLGLLDIRQAPGTPVTLGPIPGPAGERWCAGARDRAGADPAVASLSSGGQLRLTDLRNPRRPTWRARCPPTTGPSADGELLRVTWAPALDGCLAVSGLDGAVRVYDSTSAPGDGAEPLFVHKGHLFTGPGETPPPVTAHAWHPWRPRTLLSAATDGSLHVWDWADPGAAR